MIPQCELCVRDRVTRWYYEDDLVAIFDCKSPACGLPMVVLKRHTMSPTPEEVEHMEAVARQAFGESVTFRKNQRTIADHFHWHVLRS